MFGKLCVCLDAVPPIETKLSKRIYGIPEKEFILSVKIIGPNIETRTEGEVSRFWIQGVAIISIPIHTTFSTPA